MLIPLYIFFDKLTPSCEGHHYGTLNEQKGNYLNQEGVFVHNSHFIDRFVNIDSIYGQFRPSSGGLAGYFRRCTCTLLPDSTSSIR